MYGIRMWEMAEKNGNDVDIGILEENNITEWKLENEDTFRTIILYIERMRTNERKEKTLSPLVENGTNTKPSLNLGRRRKPPYAEFCVCSWSFPSIQKSITLQIEPQSAHEVLSLNIFKFRDFPSALVLSSILEFLKDTTTKYHNMRRYHHFDFLFPREILA